MSMIKPMELVSICKAAELLHYGVNILELESIDAYYNSKTKKLQTRISDLIPDMSFHFTEEAMSFLDWDLGTFVIRNGSDYEEVFDNNLTDVEKSFTCIDIDLTNLKKIMMCIRQKNWETFSDIERKTYDEIYLKEIEESRKNYDYNNIDCPMVKELSKDSIRQPLEILLTLSSYPKDVGEGLLKVYDEDQEDFEIDSLKEYPIIDNRMYLKLSPFDKEELKSKCSAPWVDSVDYIVISRNPYDWYFCSYGSNIQSCFSINSDNAGWNGMVPMAMSKGSYLIYATTGKANKINIISGSKWFVPRMLWRCWGWLSSDNELLLDRPYSSGDTDTQQKINLTTYVSNYYLNSRKFEQETDISLKYGTALKKIFTDYNLHTYPDSISFKDTFNYKGICYGTRSFVGRSSINIPLLNVAKKVSSIHPLFRYSDYYDIVNGELFASKRCPITNLPIPIDQDKSVYADMFTKPVSKCIVLTYCDGLFKLDQASSKFLRDNGYLFYDTEDLRNTSYREPNCLKCFPSFLMAAYCVSIKSFKEYITSIAKRSGYNIIVRFIEGDKVTFVKYKG